MGRHYYSGNNVEKALSIEELRQMARRRLPGFVFEYLEGGAEDEVTLRRNRRVFDQLEFVPRTLVKSSSVDPSTSIFGRPLVAADADRADRVLRTARPGWRFVPCARCGLPWEFPLFRAPCPML